MVGFSFGQPATTTSGNTLAFGQSNVSGSGFNFGSGSQPTATAVVSPLTASGSATTGGGGGFSFGQSTSTPGAPAVNFGLSSNTATSPAQPTTSIASGGFSFAQPAASGGLGLTQPAASGGFGLTQPAASGGFGLTQPAASGGFGLTQPAASGGFGLTQPAASGGFGLTQPAASGTSGFSVGLSQTSNPSSAPSLFAPPSTATTTALQVQTSSFGLSAPSLSTGFLGSTSTQSTQPLTGLNFGLTTTTVNSGGLFSQTTGGTGLNFSNPSSSTTGFSSNIASSGNTTGFSFSTPNTGLGGTSTPSIGLGGTLQSATSSAAGLGGLQSSSTDSGSGGVLSGKTDGASPKDAPLPQDIFGTVAQFESYKDAEKKFSEENMRRTAAPFHKLVDDTKKLRQLIHKLSSQHTHLHASARKLKSSVIEEAENVEMARRTQDTPTTLQGNNTAPEEFFFRLIRSFEERMTFCRNKIEEVEKCVRNNGSSATISPEEMKEILKKEHNTVKVLAAKIYSLRSRLISLANRSSEITLPDSLLTGPRRTDLQPSTDLHNIDLSILRPLGEKTSGLLDFQTGQQKAKALSLGASPPTIPLSQSSMPNILGSSNSGGLFSGATGTSSSTGFGSLNFGSGSANKSGFGASSSIFGNQSAQGQSVGGFGSPGTGIGGFGSPATGIGGFGSTGTGVGGFGSTGTAMGGFGSPGTAFGGAKSIKRGK